MSGLVSVIIPTHKGQRSLPRAINSVLKQSYQHFEIIVVDDNASDSDGRKETEKAMAVFKDDTRIKYVKHEQNQGGAVARNTGIAIAKGDYIAFLDDDDVYFKDNLLKRVQVLENNPDYGAVFCDVLHLFGECYGCIHKADSQKLTVSGILLNEDATGSGSNIFVRASVVKSINGFDTRFVRHQDLEFCIRVLKVAKPYILSEILEAKCYNGINHEPKYDKMKVVEELYIETFKSDIEKMKESDKSLFYYRRYVKLYGIAINEGNKQHIKEAITKLQPYGFRYNLKRRLQFICARVGLNKSRLFRAYRKNNAKKNAINILKLSNIVSKEVKELIINYEE